MKLMITILLADASIEIPPKEIWDHPAIKNDAERRKRKPDEILLYVPKHHFAINKLKTPQRRGRPDIAHRSLLLILDSPLNKMGLLKVYLHTINDEIIEFSQSVRIPRDYYQFEGLMVQLLKLGKVPPEGNPLIWKLNVSLDDLLSDKYIILLDERGKKLDISIIKQVINKNPVFIIGAFQKGSYSHFYHQFLGRAFRISDYTLMTSNVICKLLTMIELCMEII